MHVIINIGSPSPMFVRTSPISLRHSPAAAQAGDSLPDSGRYSSHGLFTLAAKARETGSAVESERTAVILEGQPDRVWDRGVWSPQAYRPTFRTDKVRSPPIGW